MGTWAGNLYREQVQEWKEQHQEPVTITEFSNQKGPRNDILFYSILFYIPYTEPKSGTRAENHGWEPHSGFRAGNQRPGTWEANQVWKPGPGRNPSSGIRAGNGAP